MSTDHYVLPVSSGPWFYFWTRVHQLFVILSDAGEGPLEEEGEGEGGESGIEVPLEIKAEQEQEKPKKKKKKRKK